MGHPVFSSGGKFQLLYEPGHHDFADPSWSKAEAAEEEPGRGVLGRHVGRYDALFCTVSAALVLLSFLENPSIKLTAKMTRIYRVTHQVGKAS